MGSRKDFEPKSTAGLRVRRTKISQVSARLKAFTTQRHSWQQRATRDLNKFKPKGARDAFERPSGEAGDHAGRVGPPGPGMPRKVYCISAGDRDSTSEKVTEIEE